MAFQGFTVPAPNAGLNLVDPIDNMEPNNALELSNVFPTGLSAVVRNGYSLLADTGVASQITASYPLVLATGTTKIVDCVGAKLYEVSTGVAVDITGATVPTDARWNGEAFAKRLYLCNGVDTVQVYDGTTTVDSTFTGVTLANLINVSSYKERIWFVETNTLKGWYGNTQAVGASALNPYDFQYFFKLGGKLLFAGSWTNQTATTATDLFFACSSEGEILVYEGSSPADTTTPWGLVARFVIGKPLGYRSFLRVNHDIWIVTQQGIIPLSALFTLGAEDALDVVSRKINPLITQYAKQLPFSHLWHGCHWPQGRRVFLQIPTSSTSTILLVYGQDAKGWTIYNLYRNSDCTAICVANELPYYSSNDGKTYSGETGYADDGNPIVINGRLAFSFFGSRGNYKTFIDIRPLMKGIRGTMLQLGIDTNFQRRANLDTVTTTPGVSTPWGSPWGSPWSSDIEYIFDRFATKGQGHCGAIRFAGSVSAAPLEFYGFEVRFNLGDQV